jgi:hypothetical protein
VRYNECVRSTLREASVRVYYAVGVVAGVEGRVFGEVAGAPSRRLLAWNESAGIKRLLADHRRPAPRHHHPHLQPRVLFAISVLRIHSAFLLELLSSSWITYPHTSLLHFGFKHRNSNFRRNGAVSGTPLRLQPKDAMAGSLAAVKKELRKKTRDILKVLPEAAAASQSMTCRRRIM